MVIILFESTLKITVTVIIREWSQDSAHSLSLLHQSDKKDNVKTDRQVFITT